MNKRLLAGAVLSLVLATMPLFALAQVSDPGLSASYNQTSSQPLSSSEKTVTYQYPSSPCGTLMSQYSTVGSVGVGSGPVYALAAQACSPAAPNVNTFRTYACYNANSSSGVATFAFQCSAASATGRFTSLNAVFSTGALVRSNQDQTVTVVWNATNHFPEVKLTMSCNGIQLFQTPRGQIYCNSGKALINDDTTNAPSGVINLTAPGLSNDVALSLNATAYDAMGNQVDSADTSITLHPTVVPGATTPTGAPTVDLVANGLRGTLAANIGSQVTLSWTSTNATSCGAGSGWGGYKALNGSEIVTPSQASNYYYITCVGPGGQANSNVAVTAAGGPQQAPAISSIYPISGQPGTPIIMSGSNFDQATFIGVDGAYGSTISPQSISVSSPILLSFAVPSSLSLLAYIHLQ